MFYSRSKFGNLKEYMFNKYQPYEVQTWNQVKENRNNEMSEKRQNLNMLNSFAIWEELLMKIDAQWKIKEKKT